jgi:NAD-dependent SIR2 family protein deacetylase
VCPIFFGKINNAQLWDKIQKLRELIKAEKDFKKRVCWKCGKDLNIYDFLSDNVEYSAAKILQLWQSNLLEFHCCECFKSLKSHEIRQIERVLSTRSCSYCDSPIGLRAFIKQNNYLKLHEIKDIWLNPKANLFCDSLCRKKFIRDRRMDSTNAEDEPN